jgi:putative tryptophan/tyrosine transport system substrate-binding protein
MNKRKLGSFALGVMLIALGFPAEAQQPTGKIVRIGVLTSYHAADQRNQASLDTLRDGLREFGYVEGKNLSFELRFAERNLSQLPLLAEELVRLKVDILFAIDNGAANAAKQATSSIPIVIMVGTDPVRSKLVASLARPGGNITGLTTNSPDLAGKRLGLLKEAFPKLTRIALLASATQKYILDEAQPTAKALGVTFQHFAVKAQDPDFDGLFQTMLKQRVEGLVTEGPPIISSNRKKILQLTERQRLPAIHTELDWANDGGLMSYGANRREPFRRAAVYIDKILKGTKPVDIPVEQPTKFELVINLKTAKQIGVTIPQSVLFRADKVIK